MTPQELGEKIRQSRQAGYRDEEILPFLEQVAPEQVRSSLQAGYKATDILDHLSGMETGRVDDKPSPIDDETGAGLRERFIIGSASSPEDKLARARELYGDSARREGDDRISFVHPETGRRTYVNPSGFDLGDIAGAGREIGSGIASALPFVAGTLSTGLGGIAAGSAAGAAAGQGIDALAAGWGRSLAGDRGHREAPMQTPLEAAGEAGLDFGLGTFGGAVLGRAGKLASKAFNPMKPGIVQAFKNLGIPIPTIGTGTGSRGAAIYENAVADSLGGAGRMDAARVQAAQNFDQALERVSGEIAGQGNHVPQSAYDLGQRVWDAAQRSKDKFKDESRAFYDSLLGAYGNAPATLEHTRGAIDAVTSGLSPNAQAASRAKLNRAIVNELADERAGVLNLNTVKNAKTRIGEQLGAVNPLMPNTPQQGQLRKVYGGLKADFKAGIQDPAVLKALEKQNALEVARHNADDVIGSRLLGRRTPDQTGASLLARGLSPDSVEALRGVLSAEDFNAIRAGILRNSARPLASSGAGAGEASATQFAKMHGGAGRGGYQPETVDALWANTPRQRDLQTVADALAMAGRNANTSRTAQQSKVLDLITGTVPKTLQSGLLLGGASTMSPAMMAGAGAGVLTPRLLAGLTTNRRLINYLAKPQSKASRAVLEKAFPVMGIQGGLAVPLTGDGLLGYMSGGAR